MNRRKFLQTAAMASALPFALARKVRPIGLQLYTLRRLLGRDFEGTLREVAEIGYSEVEFAGYYNHLPTNIRRLLDELGLRSPASHVALAEPGDGLGEQIEAAKTLGNDYLVLPWLEEAQRTTDGYGKLIDRLNRAGEACKESGLRVAYHNHDFEFELIGDTIPMDLILQETDPELVDIELDLYWITKAGRDPLLYFERYPGRFRLFHVKDMSPEGGFAAVGRGTIDFPGIFQHIEDAGAKHFFVENDQPGEQAIDNVKASYEYLSQLDF